ncbi:hypothetical protein C8R45DRAFT_924285 [Mycena sanguinolenta]|nr:hypothetical protein C8R45DRAFT_924285 [Mycena sanguinolenta]
MAVVSAIYMYNIGGGGYGRRRGRQGGDDGRCWRRRGRDRCLWRWRGLVLALVVAGEVIGEVVTVVGKVAAVVRRVAKVVGTRQVLLVLQELPPSRWPCLNAVILSTSAVVITSTWHAVIHEGPHMHCLLFFFSDYRVTHMHTGMKASAGRPSLRSADEGQRRRADGHHQKRGTLICPDVTHQAGSGLSGHVRVSPGKQQIGRPYEALPRLGKESRPVSPLVLTYQAIYYEHGTMQNLKPWSG